MNCASATRNGRVSVVIPTYNRADTLPRAINSVLAQSAADICDIVVVDDGSTDATPDVVATFNGRVRYIWQPNRGAGAARNAGLRAAHNEFTAFLDSDDWWQPDKIQRQTDALRRWPEAVLVSGRSLKRFPDGTSAAPQPPAIDRDCAADLAPRLFERNFMPTPTIMLRTRALADTGLFRPHLRRSQDYDLWVRLACRGPVIYLDHHLATFAVAAQHSLSDDEPSQVRYTIQALHLLRRELRHRPDCRAAWRRGMARNLTWLRDHAYRHDDYAAAARYALLALWYAPRERARWEWSLCVDAVVRAALSHPRRRPRVPMLLSSASSSGTRPVARNGHTRAAAAHQNGRVTVVIPTYNRAHLLPRAIQSVLNQTAADTCDIVVVDDGSHDNTPEVAAGYNGAITYIRRPNGGLAAARNTGLRASHNEFAAFLDDDDEWEPTKIEQQLQVLREWPEAVFAAGRAFGRFADGRLKQRPIPKMPLDQPADFAPHLFRENFLSVPMLLVRRRYIDDAGLFYEGLRRIEDYHLWTRLACRGPGVYTDAHVATYDADTPGALSRDWYAMMRAEIRARRMLERDLERRPDCRGVWLHGLTRAHAIIRDRAFREGHYALAARHGLLSLATSPHDRPRWEWAHPLHALLRSGSAAR